MLPPNHLRPQVRGSNGLLPIMQSQMVSGCAFSTKSRVKKPLPMQKRSTKHSVMVGSTDKRRNLTVIPGSRNSRHAGHEVYGRNETSSILNGLRAIRE